MRQYLRKKGELPDIESAYDVPESGNNGFENGNQKGFIGASDSPSSEVVCLTNLSTGHNSDVSLFSCSSCFQEGLEMFNT